MKLDQLYKRMSPSHGRFSNREFEGSNIDPKYVGDNLSSPPTEDQDEEDSESIPKSNSK